MNEQNPRVRASLDRLLGHLDDHMPVDPVSQDRPLWRVLWTDPDGLDQAHWTFDAAEAERVADQVKDTPGAHLRAWDHDA